MKIIKEKINFTQISNNLLLDKSLSAKAKGIYAYLFCKPDNWDFSVDRIVNDFKDGYKSINWGIKELEEARYLTREKQKDGRNTYYIYQKPQELHQPAKTPSRQKGNLPKRLPAKTGGISNKENISNKEIEIIKNNTKVLGKKPTEDFGNPLVNEIEAIFKKATEEIGAIYIPGEKERQVLRNLWRSKVIKGIVEKRKELNNVSDFIYKTIILTRQDKFRNWKIFNWVSFRANYAKFLNSFKWQKEADLKPKKNIQYG